MAPSFTARSYTRVRGACLFGLLVLPLELGDLALAVRHASAQVELLAEHGLHIVDRPVQIGDRGRHANLRVRDSLADLSAQVVDALIGLCYRFLKTIDTLVRAIDAFVGPADLVADVDEHLQRDVVLRIHAYLHSTERSAGRPKQS